MKLDASTNEEISACAARLSYFPTLNVNGITAKTDNDEHMATVLFDFWTLNAVQMHVWVEQSKVFEGGVFLKALWEYLKKHGRTLAIGVTPGDNMASLKLQASLGFVEKYRIVDGWAVGVDMVITEKRLTDE